MQNTMLSQEVRIPPLEWSFWDLIDLSATYSQGLKQAKVTYNQSLPSCKGRLREGETTTAKVLIHLLCLEMERLRRERPSDYLFYLSDHMKSIPVSTNRGQLRTMMDEEYTKRTYTNFINRLMAADIILQKRNTSRLKLQTKDEKGKPKMVSKVAKNGRGDFILFINKSILFFRNAIVECLELPSKKRLLQVAENQSFKAPKSQKLQQPLPASLETLLINQNKCGKGVAKPPLTSTSALADELLKIGNEVSRTPTEQEKVARDFSKKPKIKTRQEPLAIQMIIAQELRDKLPSKSSPVEVSANLQQANYLEKVAKEQRFLKRLPTSDLEYFSLLLFEQISREIYPDAQEYLQLVELQAKHLLRLHLKRLEGILETNFQVISRAISLVHRHLQKHPKKYVYAILTWLRLDGEYKSGTLKYVIDNWIPQEQKRLALRIEKDTPLLQWQVAVVHSERLFLSFAKELQKGFSTGVYALKKAIANLEGIFIELGISKERQATIRATFLSKTQAIIQGTSELQNRCPSMSLQAVHLAYQKRRARC